MATTTDTLIFEFKVEDKAAKVFDAWEKRLADLEKQFRDFASGVDSSMIKAVSGAGDSLAKLDWNNVKAGFDKGISGLASLAKIGFDAILRIAESVFNAIAKIARVSFETVQDAFVNTVKKAANFEEAMLGVKKTMNLSDEQVQKYSANILKMSTEMGNIDANELAAVYQTAGQLGIRGEENLSLFTQALVQFQGATQGAISAAEAAEKLPKILAVYQVPMEQTGAATAKLANQIAYLGDNFNITEKQLLTVIGSMAGTAATIGMTQEQLLSVGTAIGIVETRFGTAGGAFVQVASKMTSEYARMAEAVGIDSEKFKQAVTTNPLEAIKMLVSEIEKIRDTSGIIAAQQAIDDMGFSGIKAGEFVKKLTMTYPILDEVMEKLNDTTAVNNKLQEEHATQMSGLNAQWDKFKAGVDNTQIILGGPFRDALGDILANGINPIIESIFSWVQNNEVLKANFERVQYALTAAALDLIRVFADVGKSINWEEVVTQVLGKIEDLGEYLRGVDWEAKFLAIKESISGLWEYLNSNDFSDFFNETKEAIAGIIRELPSLAESVKFVADVLEGLVRYTKDWITGVKLLTESIKGTFAATDKAAQDGVAAVSDLYNASIGVFPDTEYRVNETAAAVDNLTSSINQATEATQILDDVGVKHSTWPDTEEAVNKVNQAITSVGNSIKGATWKTSELGDVTRIWGDKTRVSMSDMSSTILDVTGKTEGFYKVAENTWTNLTREVGENDTAWQRNIQTVQAGASAVQGFFGATIEPMQAVSDKAEETATVIASAFGTAGQAIESAFVTAAAKATAELQALMATTGQTLAAAGGFGGISAASLQQMTTRPGILTASGLVGANQAQRARGATGMPQMQTGGMPQISQQPLTVVFEGTNIVDERSIDAFARKISEAQSTQSSRIVGA